MKCEHHNTLGIFWPEGTTCIDCGALRTRPPHGTWGGWQLPPKVAELAAELARVKAQRDALADAVRPIIIGCEAADVNGDLTERVSGDMINAAYDALSKIGKGKE